MKIITHYNTLLCSNLCYKYYCNKFSTQLSGIYGYIYILYNIIIKNSFSKNFFLDFPKTFNCKRIEHEWYYIWEKNNYFTLRNNKNVALKMLLPPPNITGTLHLGHALTITIQDILARWYFFRI